MNKKFFCVISAAFGLFLLTSCNNGKTGMMESSMSDSLVLNVDSLEADVLVQIDSLTDEFVALGNNGQIAAAKDSLAELSKREKLLRPDYLLDPNATTKLVTLIQKRSALAILLVERSVRDAYGMPLTEAEKAIARMSLEVNDPALVADSQSSLPLDEIIRLKIDYYRKHKRLDSFWGFTEAVLNEQLYLAAQNPDYYLNMVNDEDIATLHRRIELCSEALDIYAQYDPDVADLVEVRSKKLPLTDKKALDAFCSVENFRNFLIANKDAIIEVRNSMIK